MRFDRAKFYSWYRRLIDAELRQSQVNGLNELLSFIEQDPYIDDIRHAAYMLATVKHETANTYKPVHEYGPHSYFVNRYGGHTRKGKELGNDTPEEGYDYAGKGYPQTTGESNYEKAEAAIRKQYPEVVREFEERTGKKFDLTVGDQPGDKQDPQNMMDPAISYVTMSYGMRTGMFTGQKLSDHINDVQKNYKNARTIINGMDKAALIAAYAVNFETVLRKAKQSPQPVTDSPADSRPKDQPAPVSGGAKNPAQTSTAPPTVPATKGPAGSVSSVATSIADAATSWLNKAGEIQAGASRAPFLAKLARPLLTAATLATAFIYANWEIFLFIVLFTGIAVYVVLARRRRSGTK